MYAIANIAGKQFKLVKGIIIYIPKKNINDNINFNNNILLFFNNNNLEIGFPILKNIKVIIKVLEQVKGKKVIVFKKKRRKGYKKIQGYRQCYTKILIKNIYKIK